MSNYRFWLKTAIVLLLTTAALHSLSLLNEPAAQNETEQQMLHLVTTYKMDSGAGFNPTFYDLFTGLSFSFTLLFLFGGFLLMQILNSKIEPKTMSGIINIFLVVFGLCFVSCIIFTFLPPVVCTGMVFASLLAARLLFR